MKHTKLFVFISFIITLSGCTAYRYATEEDNVIGEVNLRASGELLWDYPEMNGPGIFNSIKELIDACQMPSNILASISTEDLAEICLKYPLLFSFTAFDNWNYGLDVQFENFNGLRELFKREGVSNELLKLYSEKLLKLNESNNPDGFIIELMNHEMLLSRLYDCNHLTNDDYLEVLRQLVFGYESKLMYPETFGSISFSTNFLARAYILEKMNPKCIVDNIEMGQNSFVFGGLPDQNAWALIDELSYRLISTSL